MVLALFASVLSGAAYAEESKPNVMFIAVDDLNDWVGYLKGHPQAKTPNIDKFSILGTVDFRDRPIVDYELDPCLGV